MQKRSQKLQSLQDKKRNHLKDACACDEEMRMLGKEVEEPGRHFSRHASRLCPDWATVGGQQRNWKTKSRPCGQEATVRHSPMDVTLIQPCGAAQTERFIQVMQEEFHRGFTVPASEHMAGGEEKEDWERDWDDEKAASGWYEGATVDPD